MVLTHVQSSRTASSSSLLPLNVWFWNTILFLCFQIGHVKAIHQHFHLVEFFTSAVAIVCCRKWSLGFCGIAVETLTQDKDSHHKGRVLLQLKNKWWASSSLSLQSGHMVSFSITCLLVRLIGNLSLISLQANTADLIGIYSFHRSPKSEIWVAPISSPQTRSYPLFEE